MREKEVPIGLFQLCREMKNSMAEWETRTWFPHGPKDMTGAMFWGRSGGQRDKCCGQGERKGGN